MNCLECQTSNKEAELACSGCGHSLRPTRANLYLERALLHASAGRYDLATAELNRADIEMVSFNPAQRSRYQLTARAFYVQGLIFYHQGQMEMARDVLAASVTELEGQPNSNALIAQALNMLGNISYYEDKLDEAMSQYQRSSDLAVVAGLGSTAIRAVSNLGLIHLSQGDVAAALSYYHQGLTLAEQEGDVNVLAGINRMIASLHSRYGPQDVAVEYINKAVALEPQLDNFQIRCLVIGEAGCVYARYGDLPTAEQYVREAYRLLRQASPKAAWYALVVGLAELIRQQGSPHAWFNEAYWEMISNDTDANQRDEAALHLAYYYVSQQDWERANRHLHLLRDRLRRADRLKPAEQAQLHHAAAVIQAALGQWAEATTNFETVLASTDLYPYTLAVAWQEYGTMLQAKAEATAEQSVKTAACAAWREAARRYHNLHSPHHEAAVWLRLETNDRQL